MARQVFGIGLLAVICAGLVGEVIAMRELCDSDYFYSDDRALINGAQAWVLIAPFVAFGAMRLLWDRGGWPGWLTAIGFGLVVGVLTFGVAILAAASGSSCRVFT
jgi:hypothetical protein